MLKRLLYIGTFAWHISSNQEVHSQHCSLMENRGSYRFSLKENVFLLDANLYLLSLVS